MPEHLKHNNQISNIILFLVYYPCHNVHLASIQFDHIFPDVVWNATDSPINAFCINSQKSSFFTWIID